MEKNKVLQFSSTGTDESRAMLSAHRTEHCFQVSLPLSSSSTTDFVSTVMMYLSHFKKARKVL